MTRYYGFNVASPSTPSSSSFLFPDAPLSPNPRNRTGALVAAYCITLLLAMAAAARRYFVRYTRSQSSTFRLNVFIPEDYILLFSVSCLCAFASLGIYGCLRLGWGLFDNREWTVEMVERSWRIMYAASFISDVYMTTIRLDLFSFFRRIYSRTNSRCRFCCVAMIMLSLSYLLAAAPLARTLFCGPTHPMASFDVWNFISGRCFSKGDREVRTALAVAEALLDVTVLCMVMKTVWTLSNEETKRNPGMLVKQAGKPCRPMCGMAFSACMPAFIKIYFASQANSFDFNARVMALICSQIEGAIFILVSCAPMLRTLVCPSSQLGNSKTPYNSGSAGTGVTGSSNSTTKTKVGSRSRSESVAKLTENTGSSVVTTRDRRGSNATKNSMKCSRKSVVTWSVTVVQSDAAALPAAPSPVLSQGGNNNNSNIRSCPSPADSAAAMPLGVVETVIQAAPPTDSSAEPSEVCSSVYDDENNQHDNYSTSNGFEFGFSARDAVAGTLERTRSMLGRSVDRIAAGSRSSGRLSHTASQSETTIVVGELETLELQEGMGNRLDMSAVGIDMFPMPGDGSARGAVNHDDYEDDDVAQYGRDIEEGRRPVDVTPL